MDENNEEKKEEVRETTTSSETTQSKESKGFGITAMVLGIVGILAVCIPYISLPCAILAIIFAIVGMKKPGKGMGIAGLVLGIITLVLYCLIFVAGISLFNFVTNGGAEDMMREMENTVRYIETLQ